MQVAIGYSRVSTREQGRSLRPCARGGGLPSGQAEVLQRSASHPATDLRFNEQFEYLNVVKVNLILFNFAN